MERVGKRGWKGRELDKGERQGRVLDKWERQGRGLDKAERKEEGLDKAERKQNGLGKGEWKGLGKGYFGGNYGKSNEKKYKMLIMLMKIIITFLR